MKEYLKTCAHAALFAAVFMSGVFMGPRLMGTAQAENSTQQPAVTPVVPEIVSRRIRIVDGEGKTRIILDCNEKLNSARIGMADSKGNAKVGIMASDTISSMTMFDENAKDRVNIMYYQGRPSVSIFTASASCSMGEMEDNHAPYIGVSNNGGGGARIGYIPTDNCGYICLTDKDSNAIAGFHK